MSGTWSAERMLELGRRHAEAEARADLEATMVAEPRYEFHPARLTFREGNQVRRYYSQFFERFLQHRAGPMFDELEPL